MSTPTVQILTGTGVWMLCAAAAGFFATANTALAKIHIREIVESEGADHTRTNLWLKHSARIQAAVRIWHVILLICAAGVLPFIISQLNSQSTMATAILIAVAGVVLTLFFGELVPCFIGAYYAQPIALSLMTFLFGWSIITKPLNVVVLKLAAATATLFGVKIDADMVFINEDVDDTLADMGDKDDSLEAEEHEMIKSIFEFGDTVVREVMTPRTDMVALPVTTSVDEAVSAALANGHSRLPVFEDSSDNIVGIFYVRDVLKHWEIRGKETVPALSSLLRSAFFVPETKKVNELLEEFRASKVQLAVIVDEYGGTAGIATMEDLLEEIVGEIQDEYDTEQLEDFRQIDDNSFEIDAGLPVDDINDKLGIHLPEEEDFDTLGGYIMFKLGHLPSEGETLEEKEFDISILKVIERRVERVRLTRHIESTEQEDT